MLCGGSAPVKDQAAEVFKFGLSLFKKVYKCFYLLISVLFLHGKAIYTSLNEKIMCFYFLVFCILRSSIKETVLFH
jgi:hypothetical protein